MNSLNQVWLLVIFLAVHFANDVVCGNVTMDKVLYDIEVSLDRLIEQTSGSGASLERSQNDPGSIDIAAFNVQVFGRSKMRKSFVAEHLTKIVLRYDLILIQEIRDSSGRAIKKLLRMVNANRPTAAQYAMVISKRLGRTSSKEQYAFIYRSDILQVDSSYVYDDSKDDIFQREPFVVKFKSSLTAIPSFLAIGIHTSPSAAASEVSHLVDVYDDAVSRTGTKEAIIMGDFNAGCNYVQDWSPIKLASDQRFYWLINDETDTTTKSTECPYDRFVVTGTRLLDVIEPLATEEFHFDREYHLTYDQAIKISDHYPIQMKIKTKKDFERISLKRMIEIEDSATLTDIVAPPSVASLTSKGFSLVKNLKATGDLQSFNVKSSMLTPAMSIGKVDQLKAIMGKAISETQVQAAKRHLNEISMVKFLPKNNGYYQTLRDYYKTVPFLYVVMANCEAAKKRCVLAIEVENAF